MILSNRFFRFSLLIFLIIAVFSACSKDDDLGKDVKTTNTTNSNTTNEEEPQSTEENATQRVLTMDEDSLCFSLAYPLTVDFPDGTGFAIVTNEEELIDLFEEWENNNPDAEKYPAIRFPIRVFLDGDLRTVNSEEDLVELIEFCLNEWNGEEEMEEFCFDFVYPLTVVFPEGNTQVVNDIEELFEVINAWYEANEDSDEDVTLAYPVKIVMDGEEITINNDDELENALEVCEYTFNDCFKINYPITIRLNGDDTVVNNTRELATLIEDWYENNPGTDEDPEIVYPISVTMDDGEVVTINNEEEFDVIFEECYEDDCRATNLVLGSPKNALEQVTSGIWYSKN